MRLSTYAVFPAPAACKSCWLRISLFEGAGVIDEDAGTEGELFFLVPGAGSEGALPFLVPGAGTEAPGEFPVGPAGVLPEAFSSSATMSLYLYFLARLWAVFPSLPRTWTSAPFSRSARTVSMWPRSAALISAVQPWLSLAFARAPFASRARTGSVKPKYAAQNGAGLLWL